jgi:hypothetical protein
MTASALSATRDSNRVRLTPANSAFLNVLPTLFFEAWMSVRRRLSATPLCFPLLDNSLSTALNVVSRNRVSISGNCYGLFSDFSTGQSRTSYHNTCGSMPSPSKFVFMLFLETLLPDDIVAHIGANDNNYKDSFDISSRAFALDCTTQPRHGISIPHSTEISYSAVMQH